MCAVISKVEVYCLRGNCKGLSEDHRFSPSSSQFANGSAITYRNMGSITQDPELHGGRRGAGDTLVREVGWEQAQRLLRHKSPETTMNAYSHITAGEIAEDAGDGFDQADSN
jgi:integrase